MTSRLHTYPIRTCPGGEASTTRVVGEGWIVEGKIHTCTGGENVNDPKAAPTNPPSVGPIQ